jgi:hypothetical protein
MLDTLGVCLPYETRIAIAMMAGSPDAERMARMLLKYGGGTDADVLATTRGTPPGICGSCEWQRATPSA